MGKRTGKPRGAPRGNRNRWVHGRYSAAARESRAETRRLVMACNFAIAQAKAWMACQAANEAADAAAHAPAPRCKASGGSAGRFAPAGVDQRLQPPPVDGGIPAFTASPAAPGSGQRHHHLIGNRDGRDAHIRRNDGMALGVHAGRIIGARQGRGTGAIHPAVQQRVGMGGMGYRRRPGRNRHQNQDQHQKRNHGLGHFSQFRDTKLRMLHCSITGNFVTFGSKASITRSREKTINRQEPGTAKFGEIAAQAEQKDRSRCFGLLFFWPFVFPGLLFFWPLA
jgi:hypothetical protein